MSVQSGEELLTLAQLATELQCSIENVRRLVRRREIESINVGASNQAYRIRRSVVDEFLTRRTTPVLDVRSPTRIGRPRTAS